MVPATGERRNEDEAVVIVAFGRRYPLSKIGKGLVLLGAVAGVVGGCFAIAGTLTGQQLVDTDKRAIAVVADTAKAALDQSRLNAEKLDSVMKRQEMFESAIVMLTGIECRRLREENARYLPTECDKLWKPTR